MNEWLPSAVSAILLFLLFFLIRYAISNAAKQIAINVDNEIENIKKDVDKMEEIDKMFLTEEKHVLICQNVVQGFKLAMNESNTNLKDALFGKLRDIEKKVDGLIISNDSD